MSSPTKRIQNGLLKGYRPGSIHEKGLKLGIPSNTKAKDLLARLAREEKRKNVIQS